MKYILIAALLFTSCEITNPYKGDNLIVGKTYIICSNGWPADTKDPFNPDMGQPPSVSTVVIEDKAMGYVKYCHAHELNKPHYSFSRTYEEFNDKINLCK